METWLISKRSRQIRKDDSPTSDLAAVVKSLKAFLSEVPRAECPAGLMDKGGTRSIFESIYIKITCGYLILALAASWAVAGSDSAQQPTGTILGVVKDSSGGVISRVAVGWENLPCLFL